MASGMLSMIQSRATGTIACMWQRNNAHVIPKAVVGEGDRGQIEVAQGAEVEDVGRRW